MPDHEPPPAAADDARPASQTIAAVERAIDVLLLFGVDGPGDLGVTEISAELGLSKAAVHRILTSLRGRDLVTLEPTSRRYRLGPAALGLGRAYLARIDVRAMAAPVLAELSADSGETATLSIRTGDVRMYIDQVVPRREVRMEVAVGQPFPLHAGASSKAFLAFLPGAEVEEYIRRSQLTPMTDQTVTDPDRLREELAQIRRVGYAMSFGERQAGAASAAAPVLDHEGRPAAVISVAGPAERFRAETETAIELLLTATGRLSAQMGYRGH
jgi:DNA-binding IclR family transcriptional regulator